MHPQIVPCYCKCVCVCVCVCECVCVTMIYMLLVSGNHKSVNTSIHQNESAQASSVRDTLCIRLFCKIQCDIYCTQYKNFNTRKFFNPGQTLQEKNVFKLKKSTDRETFFFNAVQWLNHMSQ